MKNNIWIYIAWAIFPFLIVFSWVIFFLPFYLTDHFITNDGYGKIAFYTLVFWPLIGLYAIKAHIGVLIWWGILFIHFTIRLSFLKTSTSPHSEAKSAREKKNLIKEINKEEF